MQTMTRIVPNRLLRGILERNIVRPSSTSDGQSSQKVHENANEKQSNEKKIEKEEAENQKIEIDGPKGPEPTRYGDWERKGRCIDF